MVENLTYFGLPQDFCGARVVQSFVFCVMSCISLFILLSLFLCFFELRLLVNTFIAP